MNFSHTFLVGVLEFSEFTNLFHVYFHAFLKTLCLMAFLCCSVLNLVLFVGSRQCFLYSALIILSSLSHSSFYHANVGLLFVCEDVLGKIFSADCSMVWTRKLCASSIVFWFCIFVFNVLSFWNCFQFVLSMFHLCCCSWSLPFFLLWWWESDHLHRVHIFCSIQVLVLLLGWQLLICCHQILCSRFLLFCKCTRGCICPVFFPSFSLLCSFSCFPIVDCVHYY